VAGQQTVCGCADHHPVWQLTGRRQNFFLAPKTRSQVQEKNSERKRAASKRKHNHEQEQFRRSNPQTVTTICSWLGIQVRYLVYKDRRRVHIPRACIVGRESWSQDLAAELHRRSLDVTLFPGGGCISSTNETSSYATNRTRQ
jgi:hypothetical protein